MIGTAPLLPAWLIALLAVLLVVVAIRAYRGPLLALRLAAVSLIIAALANPVRVPEAPPQAAARLALVVDASASMALDDGGGRTRLAAALDALDAVEAAARGRFQVEWWTLAGQLAPGRPSATGDGTDFAVLDSFANRPPSAVVLASDGADHGTREPDQALAAAAVPVSCLVVGAPDDAANVSVRLDAPSPTALPGQDITLIAHLACTPHYASRQVELTLTGDGSDSERRIITLSDGARIAFTVPVGEAAGERVWTASLPVLDGEAAAADNRSTAAVRVVDRRLHVVVAEGRPWWDSGVAVRAWRRDRQFATLAHWRAGTRVLATGGTEGQPDAAALAAADLIVLGLEPERVLGPEALQATVRAVEEGAGLILLAPGLRDDRLAALDPALWSSAPPRRVRPTTLPGTPTLLPAELLATLPEISALAVDGLRPGATVLMGTADRPLAVLRRHGGGRVVAVNAEGVWRWSLGRDEDAAGRLWRQLARLAVRDPGGLSADRPRYRVGQTARLAAEHDLAIARPDGSALAVPVQDGTAAVSLDQPGLWRIEASGQRLTLPVEDDLREATATARRDRRLDRLASTTGGVALPAERAAELAQRLVRRIELSAEAPRPEPLVVAWWWWAIIIGGMLGLEWWLRRTRHGRV